MKVLLAGLVFVLSAGLDYAYLRWIESFRQSNRWIAGLWAVCVGAIGTIAGYCVYNLSTWYVIPELAGFFVGTIIAMRKHA